MAIDALNNLPEHAIDHAALGVKNQAILDSRYVNIDGDTMTGALTITPASVGIAQTLNGHQIVTNSKSSGTAGTGSQINTGDPNTKGLIIKGNMYTPAGVQPDTIDGLILWLKADAITGLNDGNAVTTWNDSSGQGNNATQSTTDNKPIYKTNIINGEPVVRFDGSNDSLDAGVNPTAGQTMFLVGKRSAANQPFGQINPANTHRGLVGNAGSQYVVFSTYYRNGASVTPDFAAVDMGIISGKTNIAQGFERVSFVLGSGQPSYNPLNGDIAEVIVYNSVLSDLDRQSIEAYLSDKYSIALTGVSVSQTANLHEYQNSGGTVLSLIDPNGRMTIGGTTAPGGMLQVNADAATTKGQIIKGAASQSANLSEWQDSAGTPLTYIEPDGEIVIDQDSKSLKLGADQDTSLNHDGTNFNLTNVTGGIVIENDAQDGDITLKINDGGVDTTVMTVDGATGNVGIGTTGPEGKLDIANTVADGTDAILTLRNSSANSSGPVFYGYKSRGTQASKTIILDGDETSSLAGRGYDGSSFTTNAAITMAIDGTPGASSDMPGRITFKTRPDGTGQSLTEWMRITSTGNVGIGTTAPTSKLHLAAGTATAGTAPLGFTSGTLLTAAVVGKMEFLTDDYFLTITTGAARKGIVLDDGTRLTSGKIPVATTNGRLIDLTAQAYEADLKVDYTAGDLDTEAEIITAMNSTNTKINAIITKLETLGLLAAS